MSRNLRSILLVAVSFALFTPLCRAETDSEDEKTLAPYFLVTSEKDEGLHLFPLKESSAEVQIAGVIADVKVKQVYSNQGTRPIEAIYVFPGSTRAAVYGLQMTIGERVRIAKIKEREQAKIEYTQAKREGKSASLLEQQRPNVFQMSVANIMPGDEIVVELRYTELLVPTDGVYEFVAPAVVGPRYSNTPAKGAPDTERWVANPYLREHEAPTYRYNVDLSIAAGMPIRDLISPSHQVHVAYKGPDLAEVDLDSSEAYGGDRDYIVRYRLEGNAIESGLLLQQGEKENFFLLMMQPPERPAAREIPPREYIFIVDVSGSMYGFPLDTSKELFRNLLGGLRDIDSFNMLFFSGGSWSLANTSVAATPENIQRAITMLDSQQGGGGTELLPALQHAMSFPQPEGTSRTFVIATDGYVSIEADTFDYIRQNLNRANFFAFGIGSSVNRYLIDGIARAGQGEPFVVTSPQEAPRLAHKFQKYIETPVLTGITVDFGDFDVYDVNPTKVPDIFAERPVVMYGKWRGTPSGDIRLKGLRGAHEFTDSLDVSQGRILEESQALRYLWARNRIAELGDYEKANPTGERKLEITNLGLTYNLLTAYTSFIAVDDVIRNTSGNSTTVKQPLPLPKGVSELSVGGEGHIGTSPEPETNALLAVLSLLLLSALFRRRQELFGWSRR